MIGGRLRVGMVVELGGERSRIERREVIRHRLSGRILGYKVWTHPNEYHLVGLTDEVPAYTSGGQEL